MWQESIILGVGFIPRLKSWAFSAVIVTLNIISLYILEALQTPI